MGRSVDRFFRENFFLWDRGNFTTLNVPNIVDVNGINASGQIVGELLSDGIRGFLLDDGNVTTIEVPGSIETISAAINESGQIVGLYLLPVGFEHGFIAE